LYRSSLRAKLKSDISYHERPSTIFLTRKNKFNFQYGIRVVYTYLFTSLKKGKRHHIYRMASAEYLRFYISVRRSFTDRKICENTSHFKERSGTYSLFESQFKIYCKEEVQPATLVQGLSQKRYASKCIHVSAFLCRISDHLL